MPRGQDLRVGYGPLSPSPGNTTWLSVAWDWLTGDSTVTTTTTTTVAVVGTSSILVGEVARPTQVAAVGAVPGVGIGTGVVVGAGHVVAVSAVGVPVVSASVPVGSLSVSAHTVVLDPSVGSGSTVTVQPMDVVVSIGALAWVGSALRVASTIHTVTAATATINRVDRPVTSTINRIDRPATARSTP